MAKKVWQSEDGAVFDTEEECQEYERIGQLLNDLYLAFDNVKEGYEDEQDEKWGFKEGFLLLISNLSKEDLVRYKNDFKRLADIIDGKIANPRSRP